MTKRPDEARDVDEVPRTDEVELDDEALEDVSGGSVNTSAVLGTSIGFPDVCKTPTPGGPVPTPYPTMPSTDPTTSVKVKSDPIDVQTSTFKKVSGDSPGG